MKDAMKILISVFALALCLALATTAYGQSSVEGYNDQAGQIQAQVGGGDGGDNGGSGSDPVTQTVANTGSAGDSGGSLPFTGLDVALLLGAGGMLVVAGLGMRRLTRAPGSA
jgi:hypothetical protein